MATESTPSWLIQSVVRTASILDLFTLDQPVWTEGDIAANTGLNRSTVYRFCQTLVRLGYLYQVSPGTYRPGVRALSLGQVAIGSLDVVEMAQPLLQALRDELGETINMSVLDHDEIIYVARLRGPGLLDTRLQIGSRLPALHTSMGRAMLACLPPTELDAILAKAKLTAFTSSTVLDTDRIRQIIETARDTGYVLNEEELTVGLRGVAVAIRYRDGRPAAAINVAATRPFRPGEVTDLLVPKLREVADSIGRMLPA